MLTQLSNVKDVVGRVRSEVEDDSLGLTLESYVDVVTHAIVQVRRHISSLKFSDIMQFKLSIAATALNAEVKGYGHAGGTALHDLAYVTFPFLYNFRDACALNE